MKQRYINTDLDLKSKHDLSSISAYLDEEADLLHAEEFEPGMWYVCAEAPGSGIADDPQSSAERDIDALLTLLESMTPEQQALLRTCETIEFNIGWHSSEHRPEGHFSLPPAILSRIAALGGALAVTVYPSSENE